MKDIFLCRKTVYNIRLGVSKEVEIRKQKHHGLNRGDFIKAIFKDKKIKRYSGEDDEGKPIYQDAGMTRGWVTKYERIEK